MEPIKTTTQNYRPLTVQKETPAGEPRCSREELTEKFRTKLNADREEAGYAPMSYPRVAKMFTGLTEAAMLRIYNDCLKARAFGSLLKFKLAQITPPDKPIGPPRPGC
jgi:hypothetical protein